MQTCANHVQTLQTCSLPSTASSTTLFPFSGLGLQHKPSIASNQGNDSCGDRGLEIQQDPDIKKELESFCSLGREIKQEFQPSLDQTLELKQECQMKQETQSLFGEGMHIKPEVQCKCESEEDKESFLSKAIVPKLEETLEETGKNNYIYDSPA